jgi:hypothetical protein
MIGLKRKIRQKIGADHLQAVATRFVPSQHQARCFQRFLDRQGLVEYCFGTVILKRYLKFWLSLLCVA